MLLAPSQAECQSWVEACKKSQKGIENKKEKKGQKFQADGICLDDFNLVLVLGRGKYGKIQLVQCKRDGELYAMKEIYQKFLETEQIEQIITERNVLLKARHPFLVALHHTFQTPRKIYLILEYVPGKELFSHLKDDSRFSEQRTVLYAAEILLGLGYLHKLGFIYRDLCSENILVDKDGHLKITCFSLASFCCWYSPEYIAPEMLQQQKCTRAVDWWSYGTLVYEMLTGLPPFYDENTQKMYQMILKEHVVFPSYVSEVAKDLITKLLDKNPATRLGASEEDVEEIKRHPFFSSLNWNDVLEKRYTPEWVPEIRNETDMDYTSDYVCFPDELAVTFEDDTNMLDQQEFVGFTCGNDVMFDDI